MVGGFSRQAAALRRSVSIGSPRIQQRACMRIRLARRWGNRWWWTKPTRRSGSDRDAGSPGCPADGYTLYFGTLGTQVITPVINTYRGIANPIDVRKELIRNWLLATIPIVLVVNPKVPANSVREFIEYPRPTPAS